MVLATFFSFPVPALSAPDIALCETCHGKGGNSEIALTPSIAGQPETFITNQLIYFREGLRASPVMQGVAKGMKDPDAIALSYWNVLQQPRSAWTWEVELRPWVEKF